MLRLPTMYRAGTSIVTLLVFVVVIIAAVGWHVAHAAPADRVDGTTTASWLPRATPTRSRTATTTATPVSNPADNTVSVIDGLTRAVGTVAVGQFPQAIVVNPATNKVYVANSASNTVTEIDGLTNTTSTIIVGAGAYSLVVNATTNKIFV